MKKFNGFEAHLLEQGLKMYVDSIVKDIVEAERSGRIPIMTAGYIEMIQSEILVKLKSLTLKEK
jgi:hypothetical protein